MNKNQDKGFTLVELLIVIVILGILATVTVFAVRGITTQGEENACKVEKRTAETAIESYYAQNSRTDATNISALVPAYMKDTPQNVTVAFPAGVTPTVTGNVSNC